MKLGIVGCGLIGNKRAFQLPSDVILVAVCDIDASKANKLATIHPHKPLALDNWVNLLKCDIDTVIIATNHKDLFPIALDCIAKRKHILIEKPVGMHSKEVLALLEWSKSLNMKNINYKNDIIVHVGFNHRYHPAFMKAKEFICDDVIGPLMHIRARYGHGGRKDYEKEWRGNPALAGGGELVEQGIHLIDLARWFLGDFKTVEGFATTSFWNQELDDNAFMTLKTFDGKTAFMHCSCTEWKNKFSFEIFGKNGKIEIEGLGGSYGVEQCTLYERPVNFGPPRTTIWEYPGEDRSWEKEFEWFMHDIKYPHNALESCTLEDALAAWEVIEKIYQNSKGI